ncbi:hypothetical protein [Halopiger aswanensis]|uniref:hypothetical protein n=1 Tax=Halopiger aswanensis TaxID=148449 RepID=UPI0011C47968|nr:hypothetical protein [Halopiger aswanensis]
MTRAYCETCDWSYEIDDRDERPVLDRAMIEHHAETGHSVVAADASARAANERAAQDDRTTDRKRNC